MKPALLRLQAKEDRREEVRYYRDRASPEIAKALVLATKEALDLIEQQPGIGSLRLGELAEIPGLRSWRVTGFPLLWFYFERDDHIDVVRLLGERQDVVSLLS